MFGVMVVENIRVWRFCGKFVNRYWSLVLKEEFRSLFVLFKIKNLSF